MIGNESMHEVLTEMRETRNNPQLDRALKHYARRVEVCWAKDRKDVFRAGVRTGKGGVK